MKILKCHCGAIEAKIDVSDNLEKTIKMEHSLETGELLTQKFVLLRPY